VAVNEDNRIKVVMTNLTMKNMKFIDLFAGIGGFRFALEELGAKCVFSSDIDYYARETYKANFGEEPSGDITKIEAKAIPSHDILCGGFPCQPFSISGKREGFNDSRGTLFHDIARIVKHHKPKIIFLENVANLKKHEDGQTISYMVEVLEELGYNVYWQLLDASRYGVPQSRKRIYFVAFRKNLRVKEFFFPEPNEKLVVVEDILDAPEKTEQYIVQRKDVTWYKPDTKEKQRSPYRLGIVGKGGQGNRIYSTKGTGITLSAQSGGAGAKTGLYLVEGKIRKLSPNECRKLQGFPKTFKTSPHVSENQLLKQFGNSVAVPVLKSIAEKINESL
jgi:DNA (cytosine-5)-methyltransferase 1